MRRSRSSPAGTWGQSAHAAFGTRALAGPATPALLASAALAMISLAAIAAATAARPATALPAALAAATAARPATALPAALRSDAMPHPEYILANSLWDDGRAEFSIYSGTTERYGQTRPIEERLIVVKEDLLDGTLVKSDSGPIEGQTITAIKLNTIADYPTGTYTYHEMSTVMFERASLSVLKETMSHTEGCGITFVRVGPKHGALVHEAHSYWDGEADRETVVDWPAGAHTFADGLPVWLRQWMGGAEPRAWWSVWLMPPQVSGRSPLASTRPIQARITRTDGGTLRVPAGAFATRRFDVATSTGTDSYWLDRRFPYVMVRLESAAGRRLELRKTLRLDYWKHNMNGDESILK